MRGHYRVNLGTLRVNWGPISIEHIKHHYKHVIQASAPQFFGVSQNALITLPARERASKLAVCKKRIKKLLTYFV
nr:MAG TPA: hypothetical protein [Caudoviricetes sp.]